MHTITNAGTIRFNMIGELDFIPIKAYVNTNSMANILSLNESNALPGAYVKYNGDIGDAFYVIFKTGRVMQFTKTFLGLYMYNT